MSRGLPAGWLVLMAYGWTAAGGESEEGGELVGHLIDYLGGQVKQPRLEGAVFRHICHPC